MRYEVVGIPPAPKFFWVHPKEGTVWVRKSLKGDRGLVYTVCH